HLARGHLRVESADDAAATRAGEEVGRGAARRDDHPGAGHPDALLDTAAFVCRPAGGRGRGREGERGDEGETEDLHGILLNHTPESKPAVIMNAIPPAAATALTSTVLCLLATRE